MVLGRDYNCTEAEATMQLSTVPFCSNAEHAEIEQLLLAQGWIAHPVGANVDAFWYAALGNAPDRSEEKMRRLKRQVIGSMLGA